MTKSKILLAYYKKLWIERDLTAIDLFLADDTTNRGWIPGMTLGRHDVRELISTFHERVGAVDVKMLKSIEEEDWVSALVSLQTSRADTGQPIIVAGQALVRFNENDKIAESYNFFDFISFFEQLGQMPSDTLPICLTGQKLRWS